MERNYRVYIRLFGTRWCIRTAWKVALHRTEMRDIFVVHDTIADYRFHRPRGLIVREN